MKLSIEKLLTTSKFDSKTLNHLVTSIGNIYNILEHNQKLQLKLFEKQVQGNLQQIYNLLCQLQLSLKNQQSLVSFFKLDKATIDLQSSINIQIQDLENLVKSNYNTVNCDKEILNLNNQFFLVGNHIRTKLQFSLNHPKLNQIAIIIEFLMFESFKINEYQMIIQNKYLIENLKKYFQKQEHILQKLSNENEKALFTLNYDKAQNQLKFLVENDPYTVTSNYSQTKIYLQEDMVLIFNNFYKLQVIETNTKNINKEQLSCVNQNKEQKTQETIKIKDFGYIKFQLLNLNNSEYEFYLKNSNMDLSNHIPGIDADLYHDCNGFYMIPRDANNHYQLFYDQVLVSKDEKLNVGIQLKHKYWINVEINKQKFDYFLFD